MWKITRKNIILVTFELTDLVNLAGACIRLSNEVNLNKWILKGKWGMDQIFDQQNIYRLVHCSNLFNYLWSTWVSLCMLICENMWCSERFAAMCWLYLQVRHQYQMMEPQLWSFLTWFILQLKHSWRLLNPRIQRYWFFVTCLHFNWIFVYWCLEPRHFAVVIKVICFLLHAEVFTFCWWQKWSDFLILVVQ